jgi:hypothetical protein
MARQCSRTEGPAWHAVDQQLQVYAVVLKVYHVLLLEDRLELTDDIRGILWGTLNEINVPTLPRTACLISGVS